MFKGDEKRFSLTQAIGPATLNGGGKSGLRSSLGGTVTVSSVISAPYRSTSAMRLLYQFMNSEIRMLIVRKNAIMIAMFSTERPV